MVTRWTCEVASSTSWAFSVRPDLWGPGWEAWLVEGPTGIAWLVDWGRRGDPTNTADAEAPGAAEALVLGGEVVQVLHEDAAGWTWTEVAP